jgi:hypothetical protein
VAKKNLWKVFKSLSKGLEDIQGYLQRNKELGDAAAAKTEETTYNRGQDALVNADRERGLHIQLGNQQLTRMTAGQEAMAKADEAAAGRENAVIIEKLRNQGDIDLERVRQGGKTATEMAPITPRDIADIMLSTPDQGGMPEFPKKGIISELPPYINRTTTPEVFLGRVMKAYENYANSGKMDKAGVNQATAYINSGGKKTAAPMMTGSTGNASPEGEIAKQIRGMANFNWQAAMRKYPNYDWQKIKGMVNAGS